MPDLMETIKKVIESFTDDEPKPPLHVGEVMGCWSYLAFAEETKVQTGVGINSTTNRELRKVFHDCIKMFESQKELLTQFMLTEGIPLPPVSEPKPISDPNNVPLGVKLTDFELAKSLKKKINMSIQACMFSTITAIRSDLNLIWAEILKDLLAFLITLKTTLRKKGWLETPPPYTPSSSSNIGE